MILLFVILSFYASVAGIFKAKLFPEHVRALGTGLGYAISSAVFWRIYSLGCFTI